MPQTTGGGSSGRPAPAPKPKPPVVPPASPGLLGQVPVVQQVEQAGAQQQTDNAAARAVRRSLRGTPGPTTEPQQAYTPLGYLDDPLKNPAAKAERLLAGDTLQTGLNMESEQVDALGALMLQHRASLIHPALVQEHEAVAAAALVSPMPTIDLASYTAVLHQGITWAQAQTTLAGVPGAMLPYYHQAFLLNDPEQRSLYLSMLDWYGGLPEDEQATSLLGLADMSARIANGWRLSQKESPLSEGSAYVGMVAMAPFVGAGWILSKTALAYGEAASNIPGVGDPIQAGFEKARTETGGFMDAAGTGATFLLRNIIEAPVGLAVATIDEAGRSLLGKDTNFNVGDYFSSWNEVAQGSHGPIAAATADILGVGPNDSRYQGLFDAMDITGDIGAAILTGKVGVAYKTYLADTVAGGGTQLGAGWVESTFGHRTVKGVADTITKAAEGDLPVRATLLDRYPNMKPQLADELARVPAENVVSEVPRVMAEYIDRVPSRELPKVAAELKDVRETLSEYKGQDLTPGDMAQMAELRVQEVALEQRMTDLQAHEVPFEFPQRSRVASWMRDAVIDDYSTWTARRLHNMFGEGGRFDLSKWTDDMGPKARIIYDRQSSTTPPLGVEATVDSLRKTMNIAKVPKGLQRGIIEEYLTYNGKDAFFAWEKNYYNALEEGLTRGGKRELTPEAQEMLRFSDRSYEEALTSPIEIEHVLPDGSIVTTTENVVQMANGTPMPSRPSQFLGQSMMPDPGLLREASSFTRYYTRNVPKMPLSIARFVALTLPRMVMRPGLLVLRIIPMGIKIQIDQMLREVLSGMKPLDIWSRNKVDYTEAGIPIKPGIRELLPDQDITLIGTVDHELGAAVETVTSRMSTRGYTTTMPNKQRLVVGKGLVDQIKSLAEDELTRKVAAWGPEGTLRYLEDHPSTRLGRIYETDIKPTLERAGMTPEEWLARTDLQIQQVTGGNPELRAAIATGRWRVGSDMPTGEAGALELLRSELEEGKRAAGEAMTPTQQRVLNLRVEEIERRIAKLETRPQTTRTVAIQSTEIMRNEVLNAAREGRFRLPKDVTVRQRAASWNGERTMLERVQLAARNLNHTIYQGLRPLASVDAALSRGSTYRQVLKLTYDRLRAQGHTPAAALETAQYHAAFIARDLHYDISARSTVDRQLKDLMWFEPVWKENMLTYFVKLPSRAFWPAGIVAEFGGAQALLDGLKQLGLLEDHRYFNVDKGVEETELRLRVPWVSDFIQNVVGGDPNAGGMSIGGMNPAQAGQGWLPTLSPGAEAVLDGTAKVAPAPMKPLIELLANKLEFDQDAYHIGYGAVIPSGLRYGLELLGIHLPLDDLSGGAIADANRKATVQSLKWAASELGKDGIAPPVKLSTTADATDAEKAANTAEVAAYRTKLEAEASHYRLALNAIHLLGSIVFPGAFATPSGGVTLAGDAFYKARDKWESEYRYGSDEYYAAQDAYLRSHPAAWPYSVGAHDAPDGYKYDPETYSDLPTMDPNDYVDKALGSVHYWADDAPKDAEGNPTKPVLARVTKPAVGIYVQGGHPELQGVLERAAEMWNSSVGATVLKVVPDGTEGATPIRLANDRNQWYQNMEADEEAEFTEGEVRGTRTALLNEVDLTLAHEIGHALGLYHPATTSTAEHYVPATEALIEKWMEQNPHDPNVWQVAPVGLMGNEMNDQSSDFRGLGPSEGEIEWLRKQFGYVPAVSTTPDTPEKADVLSDRQRVRATATASTADLWDLNPGELHLLGVPDFEGRQRLMSTIQAIQKEFTNRYNYEASDARKAELIKERDAALEQAASHYGDDGAKVVRLTEWGSTPAMRLQVAGYFQTKESSNLVAEAATIWRQAVAKGYNPEYSSEYVDGLKTAFLNRVNQLRRADPAFDREMRRMLLGLTDKTGALLDTEGTLRLFFGTAAGLSAIGST